MVEINGFSLPQRFAVAREFWRAAVEGGRAQRTEFYQEVFESPETELHERYATEETIYLAGIAMTEALIVDILPASTTTSTTSST